MTAWIQTLSRADIAALMEEHGLSAEGNLDELRRRLREYVKANPTAIRPPEKGGATALLLPTSAGTSRSATPPGLSSPVVEVDRLNFFTPAATPGPVTGYADQARVMDQIRKWGCHFDGKDPVAFLERLEELRETYGFPGAQLLRGLPEILRGDPLLWYRNRRSAWSTWLDFLEEFRGYYFPRRYQARLCREAASRQQLPGETYAKYSTALLTLTRRAGGFTDADVLDLLLENLDPEYRLYIRPSEVTNIRELADQAAEYEEIVASRKRRENRREVSQTLTATAYNRDECCWRCKQRGHTRFDCKRPPKRFCSQCGKDGVYTRECHPPAGNASRTEAAAAVARSE